MDLINLVGTYEMQFWRSLKNGEPDGFPMGEDALGQIIYSDKGHMSAFLMRKDFDQQSSEPGFNSDGIIAYGGTWRTEGNQVIHDVKFATLLHWIGKPLIRNVTIMDEGVLLKTAPEFSKSGNRYEHELMWLPVAG